MTSAIRLWTGALVAAAASLLWSAGGASAQQVVPAAGPAPVQTAQAQPAAPAPQPPVKIVDEVKIGALAHDVGFLGHHRESGADINLELLFASPDILRYIWHPRPHFGADINSDGKTSNYYAGLTWGGTFYEPHWSRGDGFFALLSVGGSVNDGKISTTDPTRKSLGSHVLFKEGLDLGYKLNDVVSIAAYIDHISNANLANRNEGITNVGARVGYKF